MTLVRRCTALAVSVVLALSGTGVATAAQSRQARRDPAAGTYVALPPTRVLDTRIQHGGAAPATHGVLRLQLAGVGGVPSSDVSAVVLNVTAPSPAGNGYLTVYPSDAPRPIASNLNFTAGHTTANLVLTKLGSDGAVLLYNGAATTTQLVADVSGYYTGGTSTDHGALVSVTPARILDTRVKLGGTEPAGHGQVVLQVNGAGGVPATGSSAVALNVTATGAAAGGPVTVYADDGEYPPASSNLNLVAGRTVSVMVVVAVPANGKIVLHNGSTKPVQLIADVAGYFLPGQSQVPGTLTATAPARVLDTRDSDEYGPAPGPRGVVALTAVGKFAVPPTGVSAVLLSVTVTGAQAGGYVSVYAGGTARPHASNVNFAAGQTVANLVIAPVSSTGVIDLYNGSTGRTQLIADVEGYYSKLPNPWTATTPALSTGRDSQGIAGVSCVTSTACVAVGVWESEGAYGVGPLIETLSGTTWSPLEQASPASNVDRKLTAVSCVSSTSCVAVGNDSYNDGENHDATLPPVADTLANGKWTPSVLPLPAAAPGDLQSAELAGVSCTSATSCVAVGSYYSESDPGDGMLIEALSGTTWTATALPPPANDEVAGLSAVSCTSATACVAVGDIEPVGRTSRAAIETLSDGTWTLDTTFDPTSAATAQEWTGVSCPAAGQCVAVSDNRVAAVLSDGKWTGSTVPYGLSAVSCHSVTSCTAVGGYGADRAGDAQPEAAELQGTTWTLFGLPQPVGTGDLYAVSCPGNQSCLAGGVAVLYRPAAIYTPPLFESDLHS